jgi:hypothetical protein
VDGEATSTSCFAPMSDGFPLRACAGAILSRGEVVEVVGCSLVWTLVFCRGRKRVGVLTQLTQGSRAVWIMKKVGQLIAVQEPDWRRSA